MNRMVNVVVIVMLVGLQRVCGRSLSRPWGRVSHCRFQGAEALVQRADHQEFSTSQDPGNYDRDLDSHFCVPGAVHSHLGLTQRTARSVDATYARRLLLGLQCPRGTVLLHFRSLSLCSCALDSAPFASSAKLRR